MSHNPTRNRTRATLVLLFGVILLAACARPSLRSTGSEQPVIHSSPDDTGVKLHVDSCHAPGLVTLDSIVRVAALETGGGDASGVVIAPNLVLTAAHVLGGEDVGLVYIGQQYRQALVLGRDVQSDLALLGVGTDLLIPISISRNVLADDEAVWAVSYPLAQQQITTRGQFFYYREGGLLTSAAIDAGSSGGGLLRCINGEFSLAGMIRSYMAYYRQGKQVMVPERSISVPAETIEAFVHLNGFEL